MPGIIRGIRHEGVIKRLQEMAAIPFFIVMSRSTVRLFPVGRRLTRYVLAGLLVNLAAAQTPPSGVKIGTVHLQAALLKTKEGQAAAAELQRKANSKEQELKKLQSEIAGLREELNKGANVASQTKQDSLSMDIERKTKAFNRQVEDLRAELDQDQARILNDLGNRVVNTIRKFAADGGYGLVIDVSAGQSPVLFASEPLDVTNEVVQLFDKLSSKPAK